MGPADIITSHRQWKDHFRSSMAAKEIHDLANVESDARCEFGQWIRQPEIVRYVHLPEYELCMIRHRKFHHEAAKVAEKINQGRYLWADQMMASGSPYARASEELCVSVYALFRAMQLEDMDCSPLRQTAPYTRLAQVAGDGGVTV